MDKPGRSEASKAAPLAAAALAAVAALGVLYKAKAPASSPAEIPAVIEAPAQAPALAAQPQTVPQSQSSPLPFAGEDLKATKAAPPLELTVSAFEPERGVEQAPDDLAAPQAAQPALKPVPRPHLQPMQNLSGYLTGEHHTQAFFGTARPAPAGQSQAQATANNQLAVMLAQLSKAVATTQAPGPQRGISTPIYQARSRSGGAGASQASVSAGMETRTTAAPAPVGSTGQLAALLGQRVSQVAYPAGRAVTIYVTPWCPYCVRDVPQYQELYRNLTSRGYNVRILVTGDRQDRMDEFARAIGYGASVSNDGNPLRSYPSLLVSRDGHAIAGHLGNFMSVDEGVAWALAH